VLELGGKSPTIVHPSVDTKTAARRIAYGRFTNVGQICTAPDHVLVWPEVKDELVAHLVQAVRDFYGEDPQQSPDYGRIINRKATERLARLLDSGTAAVGGHADLDDLYIAPTVLVDVTWNSPIMQEEVFGPILPALLRTPPRASTRIEAAIGEQRARREAIDPARRSWLSTRILQLPVLPNNRQILGQRAHLWGVFAIGDTVALNQLPGPEVAMQSGDHVTFLTGFKNRFTCLLHWANAFPGG